MNVEIHFHSAPNPPNSFLRGKASPWLRRSMQESASVVVRPEPEDPEDLFGEILLFSCFALRQLVNFGPEDEVSSHLGMVLVRAHEVLAGLSRPEPLADLLAEMHGTDLLLERMFGDLAAAEFGAPTLIDHPGHPGRRSFRAQLRYSGTVRFTCRPEGFGLIRFGTDIVYYAPTAVTVLLRYLADKRKDDRRYLLRLGSTALACASLFSDGKVLVANQLKTAVVIASTIYWDDSDDDPGKWLQHLQTLL